MGSRDTGTSNPNTREGFLKEASMGRIWPCDRDWEKNTFYSEGKVEAQA